MVWHGVVWHGVVWHGVVCQAHVYDVVWHGMVWCVGAVCVWVWVGWSVAWFWLVSWLVGCLGCWMVGRLEGCLEGWVVG